MGDLEKLSTLYDDSVQYRQHKSLGAWFPTRARYPHYCRECGDKLPDYLIGICVPCFERAANE